MQKIEKILVIEDQKGPIGAIQYALSKSLPPLNLDPEVRYVTNYADAAKEIASDQRFDLILLDHRMPKVDLGDLEDRDMRAFSDNLADIGYNLIPVIRTQQPQSIIIGTSSMRDEIKGLNQMPDENIVKSDMYSPEKEFSPLLRRLVTED